MIFNCPECEKKYILSANALGADGKTVRCVSCKHEWFQQPEAQNYQEPEEEPESEEVWDDTDDIRETVNDRLEGFFEDDDDSDFEEATSDNDEGNALDDDSNDENHIEAGDEEETDEKPLEQIIQELSAQNNEDEEEEVSQPQENEEGELDIPKGVKPLSEEDESEQKSSKTKKKKTKKAKKEKKPKVKKVKVKKERVEETAMARLMGFAASIVLFIGFIIFAIIAKPQILSAWPASAAIYELAGISVAVEGDELVIESLTAEISEDGSLLNIKGNIVNLKQGEAVIPPMVASFKLNDDTGANKWTFNPPQNVVDGEASVEFTASYDAPPEDISMVNVTFEKQLK